MLKLSYFIFNRSAPATPLLPPKSSYKFGAKKHQISPPQIMNISTPTGILIHLSQCHIKARALRAPAQGPRLKRAPKLIFHVTY